jgi:starvation-inducible DNA-binding protein
MLPARKEEPMYETSNDLSQKTRESAIAMLNELLADAIDLHLQAKQAHWNIKGPNFVGLHELFDRVAGQATEYADLMAERAVALGGVARGTLQVVFGQTHLLEYPLEFGDWRAHVLAMRNALATFGRGVRRAIDGATALNDADTGPVHRDLSRSGQVSLDGRSTRSGCTSGRQKGRTAPHAARGVATMIQSWSNDSLASP